MTTVTLSIDVAKLKRQLEKARIDAIAAGHGFDLLEVRPRVDLTVIHEGPTEIVLEASLIGFPE